MKALWMTVIAAALMVGPAVRAQDLVQDTKKGVDKTADATKDAGKDVAHGTSKAAKSTGHTLVYWQQTETGWESKG